MFELSDHPLTGADGLRELGLPGPLVDRWQRFTAPLERSVVLAYGGENLLGAALVVHRLLGAYRKVAGLWVAPVVDADEVRGELLDHIVARAWEAGAVVVKLETTAFLGSATAPRGWALVPSPVMSGPVPEVLDPVPDALVRWRTPRAPTTVPYMRQTSDFTCGPASLIMALSAAGLLPAPSRAAEFAFWRQATLVLACDPYGLALVAAREGLQVELTVTTDDFLLLEGLESDQARDVRRYIQSGFRAEVAAASGISVRVGPFTAEDVCAVVRAGGMAIVLIDEHPFHCETCPHWILVHDIVDGHLLIQDPWSEVAAGESWVDAYDLPVLPADLERLARFGDPAYGALLAVSAPGGQ